MKESVKAKRPTRMHSMHSARNAIVPAANNFYELVIANFDEERCVNTLVWIDELVDSWNTKPPFIEYYSTMDREPNKKLQCAEIVHCWVEGRRVKARVRISGPYSRHLKDVLFNSPNFDIALKGTYFPNSTHPNPVRMKYVQITGLRFIFPDLRRW